MSETGGTENTGFPQDSETSEPPQYTTADLEAARELLQRAGELDPLSQPGPAATDQADLGAQIHASGAEASQVDTADLLRQIQAMQAKMERLEASARQQNAPDVVKYADALAQHTAAKAAAHPGLADELAPLAAQASGLAESAAQAADSNAPGSVAKDAEAVGRWISTHARRLPHVDFGYLAELAEEVGAAAAKLAA